MKADETGETGRWAKRGRWKKRGRGGEGERGREARGGVQGRVRSEEGDKEGFDGEI